MQRGCRLVRVEEGPIVALRGCGLIRVSPYVPPIVDIGPYNVPLA